MVLGVAYPKAVLFDLDGTLIDSAPDICAAVNELLATRGLPPVSVEQAARMIGNGVEKLVERAFVAVDHPLDPADLKRALADMAPIYLRHTINLTTLMPGVREAMASLHVNGVAMAVVTNKPQAATRDILRHFGLEEMLSAVIGGDAVVNKKPAPDALFLALSKMNVGVESAVMVGDSKADAGAGRNAGVPVILVRGGYSLEPLEELGADLILDTMAQLPSALRPAAAA